MLYAVEAFADALARVGDQDKCLRVAFFDEISQPYCLDAVQGSEDDVFVFPGISALCLTDAGAPAESVYDEIADRLGAVAHDIEVF